MAAQTGLIASIAFAIPTALIPLVYRPEHNVMLFLLDARIYVIGLTTTAVLLTVLPGSSPKREQVHSFAQSIAAAG